LSVTGFAVIHSNLEASQYVEEFADLTIGKAKQSRKYHIIRKITDFRIKLQET
jgi:hypothetical protein